MREYWLAFGFEHTALLVKSGLSFHQALAVVARDIENKQISQAFQVAADKASAGVPLMEIKELIRLIPDSMAGLLELSSNKSDLKDTLKFISDSILHRTNPDIQQTRTLFGPGQIVFMMVVFFIFIGVVLDKTVGVFAHLFDSLGSNLPLPTQICFKLNSIMEGHRLQIGLVLIIVYLVIVFLYRFRNRSKIAAWTMWHLPPFCWFIQYDYLINLIEYLMAGLKLRLGWEKIFQVMARTTKNPLWVEKADIVVEATANGEPLDQAFATAGIPASDIAEVVMHYREDDLHQSLSEYQDSLMRESLMRYQRLIIKFNYMTYWLTAIIIGFVVIAMYLPMFAFIGEF
ncbi:type II secretion system F family protein [bacterium]|nr:type II secretion system F family protein [bacterium]